MLTEKDSRGSLTAPTLLLQGIDFRECEDDPSSVLVYLETYSSDETVVFGTDVLIGDRPVSPQVLRVSKKKLRKSLEDLIRKLDSLS